MTCSRLCLIMAFSIAITGTVLVSHAAFAIGAGQYVVTDLGSFGGIDSGSNAINANGQTIGDGINALGQEHAFLLISSASSSITTPEPTSLTLLALAFPLLLTRRRKLA